MGRVLVGSLIWRVNVMRAIRILFAVLVAISSLAGTGAAGSASTTSTTDGVAPGAVGLLDCNGY